MKLKSLRGFIVARQLFTPTSRTNSVKELVQTWQDGARGYNVSNPFAVGDRPDQTASSCFQMELRLKASSVLVLASAARSLCRMHV
jgi:hypothetical protein